MSDPEVDLDQTIRELAAIFASAYLRLRFPENEPAQLDSGEGKSASCDCRLTP